ncbi:MAG: response regulator transcription factor [Bacteroidaceae bacterium]|nr:response regulator transcription factor [Bacteroidaceae bacterium]
MKQQRILIVDDEQDLGEILQFNLMSAGYEAETAYSAEEALEGGIERFDLLLLDVMMEGLSGFELAERLKANPATQEIPIIFLTAKDTEDDTLTGFGLGADDYIAKPFSVREVLARIKAVLNRTAKPMEEEMEMFTYKGLSMNLNDKTVSIDGKTATLTKTEFELLLLFLTHRGRVFSRQEVIDQVWRKDVIVTDRTVDVNITRMRKKIGTYSSCIVSRPGYGYLFEEN